MRKLFLAAAAIVSAIAAPAFAATSIAFQQGGTGPFNLYGQVAVYENFNSQMTGGGLTVLPTSGSNVERPAYAQDGSPVNTGSGDVGSGNFGAVLANQSWTYILPNPAQVFSFIIGSLDTAADTFNSITLNFESGAPVTLNGGEIIGQATNYAPGIPGQDPKSGLVNGRVTFDRGGAPGIVSVVFNSTLHPFEFDDFALAVPEPAAWGMMLLGFGLIGGALRLRRRSAALATA